jgi:hypothetical protein
MISHSHATHTIGYSFVYQTGNTGLTVQKRVLRMDMKVNEIFHLLLALPFSRYKDMAFYPWHTDKWSFFGTFYKKIALFGTLLI